MTSRLKPGDPAPAFTLPDADGNPVSLADYQGRRVILYAYPAASTPGCTKQACDFRDSLAELNGAGLDVIGISPDKPAKLAKFRDEQKLTFPLLSDPDREVLMAWGAYGEKAMYGKTVLGVIRSTFVVDEKGKIASAAAARSSTQRCRLSLMLCACVCGSSTQVTRIFADGNAAANSAMNGIEPPTPVSTGSLCHAWRNA